MAHATSLLKAVSEGSAPPEGAYIIASRFDPLSRYSIYEVTLYRGGGDIATTDEGFLLRGGGHRIYLLVEPPEFPDRSREPLSRDTGRSIPLRFEDLSIVRGEGDERIMISRDPAVIEGSFVIPFAKGDDFTFIFYLTDDVTGAIRKFMADVLYNDSGLAKEDALEASYRLRDAVLKFPS